MTLSTFLSAAAPLLFGGLALAVSIVTVLHVRERAEAMNLIQIPNERSAHTAPVAAGGGLGIAAGTLAAGVPVALMGSQRALLAVLLVAGGLAVLGFLDDRRPLPALLRLGLQGLAVIALVFVLSSAIARGFPTLSGWVTFRVALVLFGLWWLNLYNFMDGIDGLAGQQAAFLFGATALFGLLAVGPAVFTDPLFLVLLAAMLAVLGYLRFNWPPASIMMGDAGSLFLGGLLFAVALLAIGRGWLSAPQAMILAALFVADATVTILRRLKRGENVLSAHRSHGYQRLFRKAGGALPVTGGALAVNVLILLPIALLAGQHPIAGIVAAVLVYGVLAGLLLVIGAGSPDHA